MSKRFLFKVFLPDTIYNSGNLSLVNEEAVKVLPPSLGVLFHFSETNQDAFVILKLCSKKKKKETVKKGSRAILLSIIV